MNAQSSPKAAAIRSAADALLEHMAARASSAELAELNDRGGLLEGAPAAARAFAASVAELSPIGLELAAALEPMSLELLEKFTAELRRRTLALKGWERSVLMIEDADELPAGMIAPGKWPTILGASHRTRSALESLELGELARLELARFKDPT